ncbi:glycosyl hydrolase 108 family protein [Roseospira goensis]|uniref:Lysozyme family protein n=1 Tax=Roseospira goensis TaxID=391922 RepID=A0A7W6WMG0_9PROT|nr:lysozyme family protein [Roseospira goensis]
MSAIQPHDHFPEALHYLLRHEGGYVDHAADPGGATKYGMSLRTLRAQGDLDGDGCLDWDLDGDGDVDAADVRALTPEDAATYYREHWWERHRLGLIHQGPAAIKIMDMAVNMGAGRAVALAQRACGLCGHAVAVDGLLGPRTAQALDSIPTARLRLALCGLQAGYYAGLVRMRSAFRVFETGWMRRAAFWPEED